MEKWQFVDFYEKEYTSVLSLARILTGDRASAEDITHDAFVAAYEEWDDLDRPARWVRKVVVNRARSAWRRQYAEQRAKLRLQSEVRLGNDIPHDAEGFWEVVRSLPTRQGQALALFYLEDLPVSEIAGVLGCAESTARVHLTRGRRNLSKKIRRATE